MEATQPLDDLVATTRLRVKPRLRGVSHELALYASPFLAGLLALRAQTPRALAVALIYGAGMVFLFGASALFHRPNWAPRARDLLSRVDMAGVYIAIATSWVPLLLLAVRGEQAEELLFAVGAMALLGVLHSALGWHGSKLVIVVLGSATGWLGLACAPHLLLTIGWNGLAILVLGICAVTTGALIYGFQQPDPWPETFGYHEIFHALVVFGAGCHYWVTLQIITGIP